MYIDAIPNRGSKPAYLLRESVRRGKKIIKRTLANLSFLSGNQIQMLRLILRGKTLVDADEHFHILRTRPHGHVAAVLGTLRRIGLDRLLASRATLQRQLVIAMIVMRLISPLSKLATSRGLRETTASSTLSESLGLGDVDEDDLYGALDWLLTQQQRMEKGLARRHLQAPLLVLYDVSSSYFEGRRCPLARFGHSRDGRKDKLQIIYGLLCSEEGCPVSVEVFPGNTADPKTLASQIQKLKERFGIQRVVMVGDRGMLTSARIDEDLRPAGLDWITALKATSIQELVRQEALQLSLLDERDLLEITAPEYPGERLIVCRNPLLAAERQRKREALLLATQRELAKIELATRRGARPLRGKDKIGFRVGKVIGRFKMGKHFIWEATESSFSYKRNLEKIAEEERLDGLYVIRTNVKADRLSDEQTVGAYKRLSRVERAFRSIKTVDLKVRPIFHYGADRVRAHVFLCMLAYYVEWHMRRALAPMLFDEEDDAAAVARRVSIVAPAVRSEATEHKTRLHHSKDGMPLHSFQTLLKDLATVAKNRVELSGVEFDSITQLTPLQQKAFDLLQVAHPT